MFDPFPVVLPSPQKVAKRTHWELGVFKQIRPGGPDREQGAEGGSALGEMGSVPFLCQYFGTLLLIREPTGSEITMTRTRCATPVDRVVGHNIRIRRLQRRISQTELGRRIGVTFQQVQKYENGGNRVSASRMAQIAEALGLPVIALFDGSGSLKQRDPLDSALSLLAQRHSLRLVQAFEKVAEGRTRAAVLQLVEAIGAVGRPGSRRSVAPRSRDRG